MDPDDAVPEWLASGAPTGIARDIPLRGVFPTQDPAPEGPRIPDELWRPSHGWSNYKSAEEAPESVQELLETARGNGFLDTFDSVAEAEAVVGELILNKLGMVGKTRDDGTIKRRLIWGLGEPEVNCAVYPGE